MNFNSWLCFTKAFKGQTNGELLESGFIERQILFQTFRETHKKEYDVSRR